MNKSETIEALQKYYVCLQRARLELFDAHEAKIQADSNYDTQLALAMEGGRITGSNDDQRKASRTKVLSKQLEGIQEASARVRLATLQLDLANQDVRRLQTIVQVQSTVDWTDTAQSSTN
jgi:hypothetical protein